MTISHTKRMRVTMVVANDFSLHPTAPYFVYSQQISRTVANSPKMSNHCISLTINNLHIPCSTTCVLFKCFLVKSIALRMKYACF